MAIKFNNNVIPYFVKVNKIQNSILPPVSQKTVKVNGRAGTYDFGNELGEREIKVDITIVATSEQDLPTKKNELAEWLYYDEAKELVILDEPDKHYMAKVTGNTDIDEILRIGQGSITFICADPYKYGQEISQLFVMNGYSFNTLVDDPLNVDTNSDGAADGWTKTQDSGITVNFAIDDNAQKIDVTASTTANQYVSIYKSNINVTGGKTYDFVVEHKSTNITGTFEYNIVIDWRNSSNANIQYDNYPYIRTNTPDWTKITLYATAPTNAVKCYIKCQVHVVTAGDKGTVWFRNVKFYEETTSLEEVPANFTNNGNVATYPSFKFEFVQPTTELAIVSGDEYLYFGEPMQYDTQTPVSGRTLILDDECTTTTGWTTASTVDGGTIYGSFSSDGYRFYQNGNDFGSGSSWHGASAIKTLGQQIQDFTVELHCALNTSQKKEMGRVELYLLDQNNAQIGKIAVKDISKTLESPQMEARAGSLASGKLFVANRGGYTGKEGYFKDFEGFLRITRKGNKWTFYCARKDPVTGKLSAQFSYPFVDAKNQYMTKLAGVQIHLAQYGTNPVPARFFISAVKVWQENTPQSTEVPYIFTVGDVLEIDCASGSITKNGEPFYADLNASSDWIKLEPGVNGILLSPPVTTHGYITYTERWL